MMSHLTFIRDCLNANSIPVIRDRWLDVLPPRIRRYGCSLYGVYVYAGHRECVREEVQ